MGHLTHIKCTSCDFEAEFLTGGGMNDYSLERVAHRFNADITSQLLSIAQNQEVNDYKFALKIAHCENCGFLQSVPVIDVKYNQTERFQSGYTCEKCGAVYTFRAEADVCQLKCPKCKANNLYQCGSGFWD